MINKENRALFQKNINIHKLLSVLYIKAIENSPPFILFWKQNKSQRKAHLTQFKCI